MSNQGKVERSASEMAPAAEAICDERRAVLMQGPLAPVIAWIEASGAQAFLREDDSIGWYAERLNEAALKARPTLADDDCWRTFCNFTNNEYDDGGMCLSFDFLHAFGHRETLAVLELSGNHDDDSDRDAALCVHSTLDAFIEHERRLCRKNVRGHHDDEAERSKADSDYWSWIAGSDSGSQAGSRQTDENARLFPPTPSLSSGVREALLWRLLGEIVDRHELGLGLQVRVTGHVSEGSQTSLEPAREADNGSTAAVFVCSWDDEVQVRRADGTTACIGTLRAMLFAGDRLDRMVDAITTETGWPRRRDVDHTPTSLVIRVIAELLTGAMFAGLRCENGWAIDDLCTAGWLDLVPEGRAIWRLSENLRHEAAGRFWLLHSGERNTLADEPWSASDGPAVVFDETTAEVTALVDGTRVRLMDVYAEAGKSLLAARTRVERLLEEPHAARARRVWLKG